MTKQKLRHGFKAAAKRLSLELRDELEIGHEAQLIPSDLAELYGIPILGLSDLDLHDAVATYFSHQKTGSWSALTVIDGSRRLIVLNDDHDDRRLANSLAHELSHLFLDHEPSPVLASNGKRTWDDTMEAEAHELAGEILVPYEAAKRLAIYDVSPSDVADQFLCSVELASWRMHMSGGYKIRQYSNR